MGEEKKPHHIYNKDGEVSQDRPWIFRTYAGHTNVWASNELYRSNLAKGQTGLSIAMDLPTQCGYSSDHDIAKPEIGKVGVPINSLDDMLILSELFLTVTSLLFINVAILWPTSKQVTSFSVWVMRRPAGRHFLVVGIFSFALNK